MKILIRLSSVLLAGAMIAAGPAASAAEPDTRPAAAVKTQKFVTITVERFDPAHRRLSTEVLTGAGGLGVDESGSGGKPSASGCIKVTVNNYERSLFGATLFGYHTWTSWCWNRAAYSVSNITTGFYLSDVDVTWEWAGEVTRDLRFYPWAQGHSNSGYWNYRMGHFRQCWPWTCVHKYPSNTLRSHSDGTWTWSTT